jgi:hypothetical protein
LIYLTKKYAEDLNITPLCFIFVELRDYTYYHDFPSIHESSFMTLVSTVDFTRSSTTGHEQNLSQKGCVGVVKLIGFWHNKLKEIKKWN